MREAARQRALAESGVDDRELDRAKRLPRHVRSIESHPDLDEGAMSLLVEVHAFLARFGDLVDLNQQDMLPIEQIMAGFGPSAEPGDPGSFAFCWTYCTLLRLMLHDLQETGVELEKRGLCRGARELAYAAPVHVLKPTGGVFCYSWNEVLRRLLMSMGLNLDFGALCMNKPNYVLQGLVDSVKPATKSHKKKADLFTLSRQAAEDLLGCKLGLAKEDDEVPPFKSPLGGSTMPAFDHVIIEPPNEEKQRLLDIAWALKQATGLKALPLADQMHVLRVLMEHLVETKAVRGAISAAIDTKANVANLVRMTQFEASRKVRIHSAVVSGAEEANGMPPLTPPAEEPLSASKPGESTPGAAAPAAQANGAASPLEANGNSQTPATPGMDGFTSQLAPMKQEDLVEKLQEYSKFLCNEVHSTRAAPIGEDRHENQYFLVSNIGLQSLPSFELLPSKKEYQGDVLKGGPEGLKFVVAVSQRRPGRQPAWRFFDASNIDAVLEFLSADAISEGRLRKNLEAVKQWVGLADDVLPPTPSKPARRRPRAALADASLPSLLLYLQNLECNLDEGSFRGEPGAVRDFRKRWRAALAKCQSTEEAGAALTLLEHATDSLKLLPGKGWGRWQVLSLLPEEYLTLHCVMLRARVFESVINPAAFDMLPSHTMATTAVARH